MASSQPKPTPSPIEVDYYGRISPDFDDVIFRHTQSPIFNHLRYHLPVEIRLEGDIVEQFVRIRALFLGEETLRLLSDAGIPTVEVDTPSRATRDAYESDQMARFEQDFATGD